MCIDVIFHGSLIAARGRHNSLMLLIPYVATVFCFISLYDDSLLFRLAAPSCSMYLDQY